MTDQIRLLGVSARGYHGVLDFEKRDGQDFVVDVVLEMDLTRAGETDDLTDTVNYAEVAGVVVQHIEGESLDLIEALAARIADAVLARWPIQAVDVVVHKPQAPVGHQFGDVQVRIRRERAEPVVIAMGSNLGDSVDTLAGAVWHLGAVEGLEVDAVSPLVETHPVGGPEQPAYLNAVVLATTRLSPQALLDALHRIEARHGRVREIRWGARTLDLDLIQYGDAAAGRDTRSDNPELTLPHPRAHKRAFVLRPWVLADPDAVLGVDGKPREVASLLEELDESGVRPGPEDWRPRW